MTALSSEAGDRIGCYLRQQWPRDTAKRVSRKFGCSPHTAKDWINGSVPRTETFLAMIEEFGAPFVAYVLEPCGDWTDLLAVASELKAIEARVSEVMLNVERMRGQS